ncbi:MAG: AraC family ligand binding domain-containing protein [Prevotella sp.]
MKDSRQTIQDLTLLNFGKERCCSSQQYGPFSRESSSIYIIISGKGLVTLDSHTYTLSAGDSFCIESGQMALYQADAEDPWTYIWVDFCGFMTSFILLKANYSRFKPIVHLDSTEKFEALVQSLFQIKGHLFVDELERRGLFFDFIAQLIRNNKSRRGEEKDIFDTASYYAHETYEPKFRPKL